MNIPAPLSPPDCDCRDLDWFPLNVERLLASELVAIGTSEERWAALMLWCRAWKQVPAGSLPDDDRVLAAFSGVGKRWLRVRSVALRGFVKCSDGRLYHTYLCGVATRAFEQKRAHRLKREADRKRLSGWREKRTGNGYETPDETRFVAVVEGEVPKKEDSVAVATGAVAPTDPAKAMWDRGLAILGQGQRSLLGKYRRDYGDTAVLAAIRQCEKEQPSDPVAYFIGCCEQHGKRNGRQTAAAADLARGYDILARTAIDIDERQSDSSPLETVD